MFFNEMKALIDKYEAEVNPVAKEVPNSWKKYSEGYEPPSKEEIKKLLRRSKVVK